mmetsp:Transcript_27599/g.60356  ORF Transcript_27599/g.60356 Transcript_27599/m.60356 type:complete len:260 (+) Transcript_27599:659-1438(+)
MGILHKLLAESSSLRGHCGTEHHHLFLLWGLHEDLLDVLPHVELFQALVTLIEHKVGELIELQVLLTGQPQHAARRANENLRGSLEHLPVLCDGHTAIDYATSQVTEVLSKSVELVFDLVGQLSSVADDENLNSLLSGFHPLQTGEDKDSSLAHARLRLAQDVRAEDSLRYTFVLYFRGVLEATVHNRSEQLWLQQEVAEATSMDGTGAALLGLAILGRLFLLALSRLILALLEIGEILLCHCKREDADGLAGATARPS